MDETRNVTDKFINLGEVIKEDLEYIAEKYNTVLKLRENMEYGSRNDMFCEGLEEDIGNYFCNLPAKIEKLIDLVVLDDE